MTRGLAQLEQAGFIRRETNPQDKRTTTVYPTQRARDIYPQIMRLISEWDSAATGLFSDEEKRALQVLLQRLTDSAKTFGKEAGASPCDGEE